MKKKKRIVCILIMAIMCLLASMPVSAAPKIKNGKIVGYDDTYADVKTNGSVDYVEFYHPYDRNYKDIVPNNYKIYVNESYTYTWMQ